jgi:hypothetical protein
MNAAASVVDGAAIYMVGGDAAAAALSGQPRFQVRVLGSPAPPTFQARKRRFG